MEALEQLLQKVLPEVTRVIQAQGAEHVPFAHWPYAPLEGPRKRVEGWLVQQPNYVPAQMITEAAGASIFDAGTASYALLALSLRYGPNQAAAWFHSIEDGKPTLGLKVTLVQGITVAEPVRIAEGISLAPFGAIPPSVMTAQADDFVLPEHQLTFGRKPTLSQLSAIIEEIPFEQKLVPNVAQQASGPPSNLRAIIEGLTLVGPSSVRPVRQWVQTADPMFEFIRNGSAYGQPFSELAWLVGSPVAVLNQPSAELVRKYVQLEKTEPRLSVATQRLNAALRRFSPGDKAIEVGTGLEAALIGEKATEITYRLALRAARLLGNTKAERIEIRNLMTAFYAVRSDAVHAGTLKPKYKSKTPQELSGWAQHILTQCLRTFAEKGRLPSWDDVELD